METLERFVRVTIKVARSTDSHFLDLWSLMRSKSDYSKFLKAKDGVHFNQLGYEFLTQVLAQKIQSIMY